MEQVLIVHTVRGVVFVILLLANGVYRHDQSKKILSSRLFENCQDALSVEFFVFE